MGRFLFLFSIFLVISCIENPKPAGPKTVFIGTYTDGTSEGIYTLRFNTETGELDGLELRAALPNPSFLTISGDRKFLYAVQETADFDSLGGGVTAFSLQENRLHELNRKGSGGAHPCHVALSGDGQLAVSNYSGGNLAVFDLEGAGSLGDRQLIDQTINDTTKRAHVHKAHFNEEGLFAADLGLDAVKRYTQQPYGWIPAAQASLDLPEGAGPRHFVFNTDRSFLYVINELNATLTVFEQNDQGDYVPIQTESTLAPDWTGGKSCADIHLSPDRRFLYGSNRGENTIVIFAVDPETGKLRLVGREGVRGDWPRNFTLDPSGNYVLVANQKSDNITVFTRDVDKGTLEYTGQFEIDSPVCLVFAD